MKETNAFLAYCFINTDFIISEHLPSVLLKSFQVLSLIRVWNYVFELVCLKLGWSIITEISYRVYILSTSKY